MYCAPKRLFDLVVSGGLLVLLTPFLAVVALVVKASDGGPVRYGQVRVGRNGKPFRLHKFRTMVPNADELEMQLRDEHSDPGSILFKMTDDPRITKPGHFLRRSSIDELPQLWNVVRGEMSLVGPRPALPHEVELMSEEERLRLRVRPGLSGLWQVSGRSNLSREDAAVPTPPMRQAVRAWCYRPKPATACRPCASACCTKPAGSRPVKACTLPANAMFRRCCVCANTLNWHSCIWRPRRKAWTCWPKSCASRRTPSTRSRVNSVRTTCWA